MIFHAFKIFQDNSTVAFFGQTDLLARDGRDLRERVGGTTPERTKSCEQQWPGFQTIRNLWLIISPQDRPWKLGPVSSMDLWKNVLFKQIPLNDIFVLCGHICEKTWNTSSHLIIGHIQRASAPVTSRFLLGRTCHFSLHSRRWRENVVSLANAAKSSNLAKLETGFASSWEPKVRCNLIKSICNLEVKWKDWAHAGFLASLVWGVLSSTVSVSSLRVFLFA